MAFVSDISSNLFSHTIPQNLSSLSLKKKTFPPLALRYQTTLQTLTLDAKLIVTGPSQLSGHVEISGSKNSALAVLAGTLCCSGTSILRRMPDLSDTRSMISILQSLGSRVEISNGEIVVNTEGICSLEPCPRSVGKMRAGFFVVGPLLSRFGEAVVALPGGCDIGARPTDLFLDGLRALGAVVELRDGKVHACAANGRRLVGGRFHLSYPSVGATETLMMAASMADGVTVLTNVAQEPEVVDLAQFLIASGAIVEGVGTGKLVIHGRKQLHGAEFTIIPDRIEAGTFAVAAAITRSCISMSPVIPHHLTCMMNRLSAAGCKIAHRDSVLEVSAVPAMVGGDLQGFHFKTCPYPGFPTDLQPQFMVLLATCNGSWTVDESVFEGRMTHVRGLQKLGARIQVCGSSALVHGKDHGSTLRGSRVVATDLRGGASLVLAGMAAEGITQIIGAAHIDRGYENLEKKLHSLGADVRRFGIQQS
ncbi:uncharacterized protein LOC131241012 [Magnolia sinica]|uniref:uncharacterized protein LOC131241012 n=1 Tax=Magnolia sinica TaxID=86752 RepID=UPI002659DD78|nr:uncharacterized protein LOC131241012 [Magnolia sinica]